MSAARYCSVYGCLNNKSTHPELSFFSIPTEEKRCLQWLQRISREDLVGRAAYHFVCEIHVDPQDLHMSKTRKLLKKTCLPRYHLPPQITDSMETQFHANSTRADSWTQVYVKKSNASSQTSTNLDDGTVIKLKSELAACKRRLQRATSETSQLKTFHKLCDHFLTKDFAKQVKKQTAIINISINKPAGDFAIFVHRAKK